MPDDVHSEHVVVVSEEDVQQEQLTDGVDAVQQFDDDVGARQVVAVQSTGHEDAVMRHHLASARQASGPMITPSHQIAVQQVNCVPSHSVNLVVSKHLFRGYHTAVFISARI